MLRFFLSASPFSAFSSAWFPMLLFRFPVLGFLFVSFHPSRLRSHSCSTGASLLLSLSGFSLAFCFLSSAFCSVLTTQPPPFPFPASRSPLAWFLRCLFFPFSPACFHAFLPVPVLGLLRFPFSVSPVSPHSGFSRFHPYAFAFGRSP